MVELLQDLFFSINLFNNALMKTSYISKNEIELGEDIKGLDIRVGIFNLIKVNFPEFDSEKIYFT